MGRPKEEGFWAGSIKTVSGIKTISTPFHNICLVDVRGGFHIVRALEIDSIGTHSILDHEDFMDICKVLKINPKMVQMPKGDNIHLLLGLDSLNLLGVPVTAIKDITMQGMNQKINYPSPAYDNLRLFSTPLSNQLFLAGVYRKAIPSQYVSLNSKASFNGFSLPHNQMDDLDTEYRYLSKCELISSTFVPQNVILNRITDIDSEGGVSPSHIDLTWEQNTQGPFFEPNSPPGSCAFSSSPSTPERAPYSPLSVQDDIPNTKEYQEYIEPSIHSDLLMKLYKTNDSDDSESIQSENSYAALANNWNDEVIDISDDNSNEDEISSSNSPEVVYSAPPSKKFKINHSPVMYSNLISSNFITNI